MKIEMFSPVKPPKRGPFAGVATRVNGVDRGYVTREIVGEPQYFIDGEPVTREAYERAVCAEKEFGAILP